MNAEKIVKIVLAVLLFLCLADWPYGYYMFVRIAATGGFIYLGFNEPNKNIGYIFFGLAVLFQPFIKISLGRELWNVLDVVVGVGLIVSAVANPHENKDETN